MFGHEREDSVRGSRLGERDQEAYEDAWYRALKTKATQRAPQNDHPDARGQREPRTAHR